MRLRIRRAFLDEGAALTELALRPKALERKEEMAR
jgi:hypothetical protein